MGDIVLASEDAYFQDASHFPRGMVPGDGQHVIWSVLAGHNRARYFLLTGMKLSAQEAHEWGVVNEVLPKDQVLDRAWEHARELVKRPPLVLRYTRQLFTEPAEARVRQRARPRPRRARPTRSRSSSRSAAEWKASTGRGTTSRGRADVAQSTRRRSPDDQHPGPLATGKGKFTPMYPELGTGPVSYEDSISPEFFAAEREAVFERTWLYVGREERLPRPGSYFTRELPGKLASIVVTRDLDGTVHAFHNVCAHRGNKVVWQEHPQEETAGQLPAVRLQVPRLALRPRRMRHPRHQRGGVLRPRQGLAAACRRCTARCSPGSSS